MKGLDERYSDSIISDDNVLERIGLTTGRYHSTMIEVCTNDDIEPPTIITDEPNTFPFIDYQLIR